MAGSLAAIVSTSGAAGAQQQTAVCELPETSVARAAPSFGSVQNLSDLGAGRSLFPQSVRVPGGTGVVWLEEPGGLSGGLSFAAVSDDGLPSARPRILSGDGQTIWSWDVASSGSYVYVVWAAWSGEPGERPVPEVYVAASSDGGGSFTGARQISKTPEITSWFPKVAASGNRVSILWHDGGNLVQARSADAGFTFPDATSSLLEGNVAATAYDIAQSGASSFAVWKQADGIFVHQISHGSQTGTVGRLPGSDSRSSAPRVAAQGENVYVLWGQRQPPVEGVPSAQDVMLARSGDDGASFATTKLSDDGQETCGYFAFGCSAGVLAADGAGVLVAWIGGPEGDRHVYSRSSLDRGVGFGETVDVGAALDGLALDGTLSEGNAYLTWMQRRAGAPRREVVLATSTDSGATYALSGGDQFLLPEAACGRGESNLSFVSALGRFFGLAWMSVPLTTRPGYDYWPDYFGDLEVGYRGGLLAEPDLELLDVAAIQAADGAKKLVQGKPTVLRARVRATLPSALAVDFSYEADDEVGSESLSKTVFIRPGTRNVYLPLAETIRPRGAAFNYSVKVDPANDVREANEGNNRQEAFDFVADTKPLRVLALPLRVAGETAPTCEETMVMAGGMGRHMRATFPVDPTETRFAYRCRPLSMPAVALDDAGVTQLLHRLGRARLTTGFDAVVAVVRPGWFREYTTDERAQRAAGIAHFNSGDRSAIVQSNNTGGWVAAHEIAHTMGWVTTGFAGEPGLDNHFANVPAPGYWVAEGEEPTAIDFMHPGTDGADVTAATGRWISKSTFDFLLDQLAHNPLDPPVIALSGVVNADGTVSSGPWYAVDDFVDAPLGSSGELGARLLDADGTELGRVGFDASHSHAPLGKEDVGEGTLDFAAFTARIPDLPGTSTVQLTQGDEVIYERTRSEYAPTVSVTSPNGGESLEIGATAEVTWEGSDPDGDELTYLVSLSTDGGASWIPIGEDVAEERLDLPVWDELLTQDALVRVIATDGLNTSEDRSDSPFAVVRVNADAKLAFWLARQVEDGVRDDIWVMNADGSGQRQVSGLDVAGPWVVGREPSWAPDGTRIVFSRPHSLPIPGFPEFAHPGGLWVVNGDGTGEHRLTSGLDTYPEWSPDGTRILFNRFKDQSRSWQQLWVMNADGSGQRMLQDDLYLSTDSASWSPDGQKLVLELPELVGQPDRGGIYVMNADGTGLTRIRPGCCGADPIWSPDGSKIAFVHDFDELWLMNVDGSDPESLYQKPDQGTVDTPDWSPDGTKIAFVYDEEEIAIVRADGTFVGKVTDTPFLPDELGPDWQPPVVEATAPLTVNAGVTYVAEEGRPVALTASAAGAGAGGAAFAWDLDADGHYDNATSSSLQTTFVDEGSFTVAAQARAADGNTATDTAEVSVANVPPEISSFAATIDEFRGGAVTAEITDPGVGDEVEATIDWGDGTPVEGTTVVRDETSAWVSASHVYAADGSYTVELTVTDSDGGEETARQALSPTAPNRAPVVGDVEAATDADVAVPLRLEGFDPDFDPIGFVTGRPPAHGTLVQLPGPGGGAAPNVVYVPAAGYSGGDSFTFTATDGHAESGEATVSITVHPLVGPSPPAPSPPPQPPSPQPQPQPAPPRDVCSYGP